MAQRDKAEIDLILSFGKSAMLFATGTNDSKQRKRQDSDTYSDTETCEIASNPDVEMCEIDVRPEGEHLYSRYIL